jgi:hypothetical protein
MNFTVEELNGRKLFKLELPDGMTSDQIAGWLEKFKHEFNTRPLPVLVEQYDDFHVENPN